MVTSRQSFAIQDAIMHSEEGASILETVFLAGRNDALQEVIDNCRLIQMRDNGLSIGSNVIVPRT